MSKTDNHSLNNSLAGKLQSNRPTHDSMEEMLNDDNDNNGGGDNDGMLACFELELKIFNKSLI